MARRTGRDGRDKARAGKTKGADAERERLLRLLRLTASNQDGEALAALRRASSLMERMELDWDALVRGWSPSMEALGEAMAVGRASGLREGRAMGLREGHLEAERAYARGLRDGEAKAGARVRAGAAHAAAPEDGPPSVVEFRRRAAKGGGDAGRDRDEDRALIAGVLRNPQSPPRTAAFVSDLGRWLDEHGALTPAQRAALRRTHDDWGLGAA